MRSHYPSKSALPKPTRAILVKRTWKGIARRGENRRGRICFSLLEFFYIVISLLLESCSYVNGFDNFRVGKRQADLSRSGSGHLIGDYRNHFLFSFLVRNQLRNAVGRGGNIKFVYRIE